MDIIYIGKSNKFLTSGHKYYAYDYGLDDYGNYHIKIRDNDNKNHILTKDFIKL